MTDLLPKVKEFSLRSFLQRNYYYIVFLGILVTICYANSLNNALLSDDLGAITNNPRLGDFNFVLEHPFFFLRPLMYFITYKLAGITPIFYRLPNVIMHFGTASVIFVLLSMIASVPIAFFASTLFAVHPLLTESITWVSGGIYTQYTFFMLLALSLYTISKKGNKYVYWISFLSYIFGLSSSEKAIAFFGILFLYELCFFDIKKNWTKLLPFFLISLGWSAVYVLRVGERINNLTSNYYQEQGLENPLWQIPVAISNYLQLIIMPDKLTLYHTEVFYNPVEFAIRALFTVAFLSLLIYMWKKNKWYFFWLSWFIIGLSPTLTPLRIAWVVAERYVYISTIGIFVCIATLCAQAIKNKKYESIIYLVFMIVVLVFIVRTIFRNIDWLNEDNLWIATGKVSPSSFFNHNNLGDVYGRHGDLQMAEKEFKTAIMINPNYADAYHNLGNTYRSMGRTDDALKQYENALKINPTIWQSYQAIAVIYFDKGDKEKAQEYMTKAVQFDPQNSILYSNLGIIYLSMGKTDKGKEALLTALQLDPNNQKAREELSKLP